MKPGWIFLLLALNLIYIFVGAICFSYLENDHDQENTPTEELGSSIEDMILSVLQQLADNETCLTYSQVQAAILFARANGSISACTASKSTGSRSKWTIRNSAYFACTVVTTIGYGNMSPATPHGQLFFIFYAILGIPLMLVFLVYVGKHFSYANQKLMDSMKCFTNHRLDKFIDTIVICSVGFTLFVLVPAVAFHHTEGWNYVTACYFAVVTLSTVGFGDYVTASEGLLFYRLMVTAWLLVGLAWFAGVISNIQSKFEETLDRRQGRVMARIQFDFVAILVKKLLVGQIISISSPILGWRDFRLTTSSILYAQIESCMQKKKQSMEESLEMATKAEPGGDELIKNKQYHRVSTSDDNQSSHSSVV